VRESGLVCAVAVIENGGFIGIGHFFLTTASNDAVNRAAELGHYVSSLLSTLGVSPRGV
jgi:hypothetical protein